MTSILTNIYKNNRIIKIIILALFSILLLCEVYDFIMLNSHSGVYSGTSFNIEFLDIIRYVLNIIGNALIVYFVYKNMDEELYKLMIIGPALHIPSELMRIKAEIIASNIYYKYLEEAPSLIYVYMRVFAMILWILLSLLYINKKPTKKIAIITSILSAFTLLYSLTELKVSSLDYYIIYIAIMFLGLYIASFASVEDGTININDLKNENENRILDIKNQNNPDNEIETLKKLKELYDEGIITKKEFELKKKQALKLSDDNE